MSVVQLHVFHQETPVPFLPQLHEGRHDAAVINNSNFSVTIVVNLLQYQQSCLFLSTPIE